MADYTSTNTGAGIDAAIDDVQASGMTGSGGNATFSGTVDIQDVVNIENASPIVNLKETGATVDEGNWRVIANVDLLKVQAANDAEAVFVDIISVARAGTVIGVVTWAGQHNIDIDGGSIDGTPIGATTPDTGNFSIVDINGGNIDNTTIGATTPAPISGTTGDFSGVLTSNGELRRIGAAGSIRSAIQNTNATSGKRTYGHVASSSDVFQFQGLDDSFGFTKTFHTIDYTTGDHTQDIGNFILTVGDFLITAGFLNIGAATELTISG
ncbi:hypothetical protein KAR91_15360, partial [Candidatus Pacearchaeota archaeon]|nr:hypothetical protein [Candidatus Pacearchaeota archaeon]